MQSFSQHGQDLFVFENFFKNRPDQGFFVDIGAYDGKALSNSLFFERLGWRGICIEPIPAVFQALQANRSSVCLNCAVSDHDGMAEFVDVDMPHFGKMYSGLRGDYDPRHTEIIKTYSLGSQIIHVPTRRLEGILTEHGVSKIDYLTIDTEGSELKILKDTNLNTFDIRVISVENNYQDPGIREYLLGCGYRFVHLFAGFDELYAK